MLESVIPNFGYLVEGQLAGSGFLSSLRLIQETLQHLKGEGFGAILTLTEEPLPTEYLHKLEFEHLHLPIAEFRAPTLEQIDTGVEFIRRQLARRHRTLVHCWGGYGRTGTLLACFLVSSGLSARNAVYTVRRVRPGSIETSEQEEIVYVYEKRRKGGEQLED